MGGAVYRLAAGPGLRRSHSSGWFRVKVGRCADECRTVGAVAFFKANLCICAQFSQADVLFTRFKHYLQHSAMNVG